MTQDGQVFELQTQAHLIRDSEFLSLPTPKAQEPGSTSPGYGDSLNDFAQRVTKGYARKDLELLRSPTASQGEGGALGEETAKARGNTVGIRDQAMDIAALNLLPTTRTSMANGASQKELNAGNPKGRLETVTNWGKFEPAIRRWEETIGRAAPAPTKPDGKDGNHRLSSVFTEWMMGLPEGWITDVGLKRNEELKACGNGVVPQQAELALRILLEGSEIQTGTRQVNLPTPTVSDTFTDKLKSSQQKPGLMTSVTLAQAVQTHLEGSQN
jgi:DNA (cytosine-5)-methyltransferase 1